MSKITAAITGVGGFVPEYILTNEELSRMVDTSDEWIMSHMGIKERHILKGEGKATSDMAVEAVLDLFSKTGCKPEEVDMLIVASVTPDMPFPSTANIVSDKLGVKKRLWLRHQRRLLRLFVQLGYRVKVWKQARTKR